MRQFLLSTHCFLKIVQIFIKIVSQKDQNWFSEKNKTFGYVGCFHFSKSFGIMVKVDLSAEIAWSQNFETFGWFTFEILCSVASFRDVLWQTGVQSQILVWELHRIPQLSENVSREQYYCSLAKLIISDVQSHEYDPGALNFQQSAEHPRMCIQWHFISLRISDK